MDFILGNLAVGSHAEAAAATPDLSAVLCVAREKDLYLPERLYHKVPVLDHHPASGPQLAEAVAWIRERAGNHRVLVCCSTGAARASSVAVAYLCLALGMGYDRAVTHVRERHPGAALLPGLEAAIRALREDARGA